MSTPNIVSQDEWLKARKDLLVKEKAFTKAREEITAARMAMPWVLVDKDYRFSGEQGEVGLIDLFGYHSQLMLQHFMFETDWNAGCKGCSFMAEGINVSAVHLAQRDVATVAVSIAPLEKLLAFRERMGWDFTWVSSAGSEFNRDFGVSFSEQEVKDGKVQYNFDDFKFPHVGELPGVSVFVKRENKVYRSYSCYARGLENTMAAYNYLDLVPKGRDEDELEYGHEWLKLRDSY
ncbi:MAG: DUF899 domain-containing protein [Pseudomonadota bacterium]